MPAPVGAHDPLQPDPLFIQQIAYDAQVPDHLLDIFELRFQALPVGWTDQHQARRCLRLAPGGKFMTVKTAATTSACRATVPDRCCRL